VATTPAGSAGRPPKARAAVTVLASTALAVAGCARVPGVYTVTRAGSGGAAAIIDGGNFSAAGYVNKIWTARLLPVYRARAVSAQQLIAALAASPAKACRQYGAVAAQDSSCAFMIKGTGRITNVTHSPAGGTLTVALAPAGGQRRSVTIETGPAFLGTAVRDAAGFIKFAQFTNQVDYADVAIALNAKVRTDVIGHTSFTAWRGRAVSFTGAAEGITPGNVVITPVQLSAAG
jgi:predicted lipoprotein